MYDVTGETLDRSYKPFDVVTNNKGDVGIIQEVGINDCQEGFDNQISYAVKWIIGDETTYAWFGHEELTLHGNLFIIIAEMSCHPSGCNEYSVQKLFNHMNR